MHRSRDTEPVGYRLYPNVRDILNQLIHFENSILVVRASGLSCSRTTSFGPFHPARLERSTSQFADKTSGLTIDISQVENVFLIDWIASGPSLEILFKQDGFAISIELGKSAYSDFIIAHLIENYAAATIEPAKLWLAGAGATMRHAIKLGLPFQSSRATADELAPLAKAFYDDGGVALDGLCGAALVEHQVVEGRGVLLVGGGGGH